MTKAPHPDTPRTVVLITPWYGGSAGGVAVSCETVASGLIGAGLRVVVLTLHRFAASEGRFGERVHSITSYGKEVGARGLRGRLGYWRRFFEVGALATALTLRHRGIVAHFHYCESAYAPLRTWFRMLGVPMVVTFRGSDINQLESGSAAAAEVSAMIRDVASVTAVSEGLLGVVHQRFPESRGKSCVVRNVVPVDVWQAAKSGAPDVARDLDVLYLGNIVHVKGPDLLLDAFRRLVERRPATTLCFVGSGSMEEELRAEVERMGLGAQVRFAGRVGRSEVAGWMRRARVLALPSRSEGLPLAAIEAQLLGVPVVAHEVGGVPQALEHGETGVLVPLGDADAFAAALERLLTSPEEWARFSLRAREWARRRFDPAMMARRYAEIYARALAGRSCDGLPAVVE